MRGPWIGPLKRGMPQTRKVGRIFAHLVTGMLVCGIALGALHWLCLATEPHWLTPEQRAVLEKAAADE